MLRIACLALILVIGSDAARLRAPLLSRARRGTPDCPKDCASSPLELSFVVDASSSVTPVNFHRCLEFIEDFVAQFEISPSAVRMSLVTFGWTEYADEAFGFAEHENKDALMDAISNVHYAQDQYTNTSAGIRFMLEHHLPEARDGVRHVAIVITDGQSQETQKTKKAAEAAHKAGLEVFAIGVGAGASVPELHTIASDSRHVFTVSSYDALDDIKKRLAYQSCDVPTFPECEMDPVDLAFVIDSSVSIGQENFTAGMDFVRKFVSEFEVDANHVRIAAVTFDEHVNTMDAFHFDEFDDKQAVLDRLKNIQWRHGQATNTGSGIAFMRDILMARARDYTARICIVLTDGNSQETEITKNEAEAAHDAGIVMYALGVGSAVDTQELHNIASGPDKVVRADNYQKLNLVKEQLINVTCKGILENTQSKGASAMAHYPLTTTQRS